MALGWRLLFRISYANIIVQWNTCYLWWSHSESRSGMFPKHTNQKQIWYNHLLCYNLLTTLENSITERWIKCFFLSFWRIDHTFLLPVCLKLGSHKWYLFYSSLKCGGFPWNRSCYCNFKDTGCLILAFTCL